MDNGELIAVFASIFLQAAPLMIAVVGETLTERAGVINLSLDGTMMLAAMTGFVAAYESDNVWIGFLAAMAVGAFFALIVAFGTIKLKQNQVAIGFVLTLLGDDLSSFLGQNYTRLPGPSLGRFSIPILSDIPVLGPLFFNQNVIFYIAVLLTVFVWWFLGRTQPGLKLRSVGERPEAAFARGVNVNFIRYFYTMVGGALVGIGGASYSLAIKIGWSEGHTRGLGWIALAIVIFGGWAPIRGALGAVLFGATKTLATVLQRLYPEVSVVAFNAIPWVLMIGVLLLVGSEWVENMILKLPKSFQRPMRKIFRVSPPLALGEDFSKK
ncbi:MAG: ABC transporter permease [Anaerolineales bacterium]